MLIHHKFYGTFVTLSLFLLLLPGSSYAVESVEGTLKSVRCVTDGDCAFDKRDPRLRAASDFVLAQSDGGFFYIFNIDRDTKLRFALDQVRITGDVNERYQSISADKMEVKKGNRYETVWRPGRAYSPYRQPGSTLPY
jgi:hypothetical protein